MAVQLVVSVLVLASLSAAADPDCSEVIKPRVLEDQSQIHGKWILHVSSWDEPSLKKDLVTVKSSWIELEPMSDDKMMSIYWADRIQDDSCLQGLANSSISGTTTHTAFTIHGHTSYHDGQYYETCPDCLLSTDTTQLPDGESKGRYIFLYTRTGKLEESQLETFKKQAECLSFLPDYHFTGTELCEDERKTPTPE